MMERLKTMKEMLMACAEGQMSHLEEVDAEELGEVIDMIKDLEEAIYYCTVVEAMKQPQEYGFDDQRRYYSEGGKRSTPSHMGKGDYTEKEYTHEFKDPREGRSPHSRRIYMETRETHQDKAAQMRELEKYMQELTLDIAEMIEDSSPEEKQLLHKKITALASKIETL